MNDTTVNIDNHEEELKDIIDLGFFDRHQVYVPDRSSNHEPKSLFECMKQYGITSVEDQYRFLDLWQPFIYINQYSISYEIACKCWCAIQDGTMSVDNGSPSYENNIFYTACYLLNDMCYHNIAHAQEIYQYYIADHYDNPRMFALRRTILRASDKSGKTKNNYYPYMDSCVHMTYYYRIEDEDVSNIYRTYVEMYRSFGKEGADIMAELGYDAIDDIIHIMSSHGLRKYTLSRKDAISIAYELHDDKKALDWFMSLLNLMKGQDRIPIKHLNADFVRKNKDTPLEFITECILMGHVDYDEYKDRLDALLNHIIDVTYPKKLAGTIRINDTNRGMVYSDTGYDVDRRAYYKVRYSPVVSSITSTFGFGSSHERYQEIPNTTVERAYKLMDKMQTLPDIVWNTFYGTHGYHYSRSCGGNVFMRPTTLGISKIGFEYSKSNKISPDINHAYHIVQAGDDAVYRWALWTNVYMVLNGQAWFFTEKKSRVKRFSWLDDYVIDGNNIVSDDMEKDADTTYSDPAVLEVVSDIISIMNTLPKTVKEMEADLDRSSMNNANEYIMDAYKKFTINMKDAL